MDTIYLPKHYFYAHLSTKPGNILMENRYSKLFQTVIVISVSFLFFNVVYSVAV